MKIIKNFSYRVFCEVNKMYFKEKFDPHVYWRPHAYHFQCVFQPNMLIKDHMFIRDPRVLNNFY